MRRYFLILFRYKSRPFNSPFLERWSINIAEGAFAPCAINNKVEKINLLFDAEIDKMEVLNIMEIPESVYNDLEDPIEYRYIVVEQNDKQD